MAGRKREKTFFYQGIFAVCLLLFSIVAFRYVARADVYLLNGSSGRIFIGDSLTVSEFFVKEEADKVLPESLQYSVSEESEDAGCIALSPDGTVLAVSEGNVAIQVTYQLTDDSSQRTETFYITVLAPETVTAKYGEKIWLAAFDMYNPYQEADLGEEGIGAYTYSFSNDSVVLDQGREGIVVQGFHDVQVYLEKTTTKILVANIEVNAPKFRRARMARATKTDAFYPGLLNCTLDSYSDYAQDAIYLAEPQWSVEDEEIVTLTESGFLAAAKGTTKIMASFTAKNGDNLILTLPVTVTDPKLTKNMLVTASGIEKKAPVSGTCSDSIFSKNKDDYSGSSEDEDGDTSAEGSGFKYANMALNGTLKGFQEGTEKITFFVDGREFSMTLVITNPRYAKNTFTMYKGLKKALPILGLHQKYSTISYASAKTSVAAVTKTGNVTAKKVGTAKLKIKADGKTFYVWVEVAAKRAYQAAKREIAISKTKTKYSQVKRMLSGFYDCSSLVSRVYRKFGVYFGSKSGWSPTAAGIGQWCSSHNKVIAKKALDYTKLVPGDLVFYSYTKNGRYKNISHIEMYVGNGMSVSASSSRNAVVHYGYGTNSVVMIARPLK